MGRQKISLWDDNSRRLVDTERNLRSVMAELNIQADIQLNCEPPLLARNRINGKTPAIQIDEGDFWTYVINKPIEKGEFKTLFQLLKDKNIMQ